MGKQIFVGNVEREIILELIGRKEEMILGREVNYRIREL